MCTQKLVFVILCVLVPNSVTIPVIIQTGIASNGGQFEDNSNSAVSLQKGITNSEAEAGFNKLYDKKLLDTALNSRYGERSNVKNDHSDAKFYNTGVAFNKNGAEGASLENKLLHKKGHHKNGFHNSYHKDEMGSNSSFFEDGESEGGEQVYKNNQGSYANALQDAKRGDHIDMSSYNNQKGDDRHIINGQNYVNDLNNVQNHNRNHYYDDRANVNQQNLGRRYGNENNYREERLHKPGYMPHNPGYVPHIPHDPGYVPHDIPAPVPVPVPDYPSRRRITIYEDPRYVPSNRYSDDRIELDIRPPNRDHFYRPPPYEYY